MIQLDRRRVRSLFCVALICASACSTTYTGEYRLGTDRTNPRPEAVVATLRSVVEPLGFDETNPGAGIRTVFQRSRGQTSRFGLDGEEAQLTLALNLSANTIVLRDYDNPDETEFTRELKQRIERALFEEYGIRVQFRRFSDFLM